MCLFRPRVKVLRSSSYHKHFLLESSGLREQVLENFVVWRPRYSLKFVDLVCVCGRSIGTAPFLGPLWAFT